MDDLSSEGDLYLLESNDLLPDINPWIIVGSGLLISVLVISVILASIFKFKITVKTPAIVRPIGELRLVQAAMEGTVKGIAVNENQTVIKGQVIAYFDASRLQTKQSQLQGDISKKQLQLSELNAQINALQAQLAAESNLADRNLEAAQATLQMQQLTYQQTQLSTHADLEEATAAMNLANEELNRFKQLQGSGAIAELQFREKVANAQVAAARVNKVRATLNPSNAQILIANAQIAQERAKAEGTLANIRREQGQLLQDQAELENQLEAAQKELKQVIKDLRGSVVRAPASGTLMQLNLRNPGQVIQPGQEIAYIAPNNSPLIIKGQINAQDINKVTPGQKVQMQVSACPYPDYGTLKGTVQAVAPDALPASASASNSATVTPAPASYEVTIRPQTTFVGYGDRQCQLQAGMEGRADIISREETVMQFILKKARLMANL